MYLSSSTKYFLMYLGTSTFLKLKYKVQASTQKNVLKYRQVQVPMYLASTLAKATSSGTVGSIQGSIDKADFQKTVHPDAFFSRSNCKTVLA